MMFEVNLCCKKNCPVVKKANDNNKIMIGEDDKWVELSNEEFTQFVKKAKNGDFDGIIKD